MRFLGLLLCIINVISAIVLIWRITGILAEALGADDQKRGCLALILEPLGILGLIFLTYRGLELVAKDLGGDVQTAANLPLDDIRVGLVALGLVSVISLAITCTGWDEDTFFAIDRDRWRIVEVVGFVSSLIGIVSFVFH